ncbi:unnamed protein product [Brassica oleracea var. botrytis]|uniref:Flavodoxin-like domain-containing protein n=1 Tax=Brassica oleracea TaxID=3712 RepID=A0A3P6FP48_BRAOL|nr:unnamed protein product [Brassica oleracea]
MTLKRASFTSSLFIVSSFQLHIYHPPPFSVHLKERISREAERRGCPASIVSNDEFDSSSLPHEDAILFVVSTTGQGDSPDSFKEFWRFLLQRNLGNSWLQRVCFAVFGLGDSGYQKYNFVTKKLDKRLLDLGATTIIEKGLGDDQHPSWYGTLKRLRNRASLKNSGQQAHLIWTTSPFLLKEEAYHPARLLNLNLLPETQIPCLSLPSSLESDNWNAASYDSLKNAEVMSPLIIVSHCPHDGGLLFFMGRSCINV